MVHRHGGTPARASARATTTTRASGTPSIESIGERAFEGSAAETIAFEGSSKLASVGKNAFKDAAKLKLTLPAGTKVSIGDDAFKGVPTVTMSSSFDLGGATASCASGLTLTPG